MPDFDRSRSLTIFGKMNNQLVVNQDGYAYAYNLDADEFELVGRIQVLTPRSDLSGTFSNYEPDAKLAEPLEPYTGKRRLRIKGNG